MNCIQDKHCCSCSMKSPLFQVLTEEELELINVNKRQVRFKKGEIIVKQGAPMSHVISFTSGIAKVYIEASGNRNLLLQFIKPTNFLGAPGIFADQIHYSSVSAIEESSVCFIDIHIFKKVIKMNERFAEQFMELISWNGIFNYERFTCLTHKNTHGRLADSLIYLHEKIFDDRDHLISISRQDMAELTGMSKDTVIRTLKELNEEGVIEIIKNDIRILEIDKLQKISMIS
ncbi:Crp/Fnr family transcriptional regulator [Lentimicrobium sp. L6]|uniref:Crp/Fnr family transcriptional regulator n=1 Tax=Lentimicrobium sp. L6 TaxID=2735916 RepID=UPI00155634C6|nr:Crp/Fnr family transcriptional regulator [Lentimicrobium sp. L6]NPD84620.1 Crp/Fnr family transcriptional regulator [Lentimicrobium sp. L6]